VKVPSAAGPAAASRRTSVFEGFILGVGTTSGTRVVVGIWARSPFGAFADAMVELPSGHRILIAPREPIAEFISSTYQFDEIRVEKMLIRHTASTVSAVSASLRLTAVLGTRTLLGQLLTLVPQAVGTNRSWAALIDPIARRVMPGVRTYGSAGNGHTEWYGALDQRRVTQLTAHLDSEPLGELRDVTPPVRFGFGSVPRHPALIRVVTSVRG
jgi:hypothetical protein